MAALTVAPTPNQAFWMLAIGATEWGYTLALPALASLLLTKRRSAADRAGAAFGIAAAALALQPTLRGLLLSRRVPHELTAAFGDAPPRATPGDQPRPAPLVVTDLVRGVRSSHVCRNREVYVTRDGHPLHMDLYHAAGAQGNAPGVLVVHGGGWQNGDSRQLPALNRYLAARGYLVAAINYRLAPRYCFPAPRNDILAALFYLKANADRLGLDANRLALLGRSAGGHLALLVAYTAADPSIRGVVAFYAPTDLRWCYQHPANPAILDGHRVLREHLGGGLDTTGSLYDAASPINHVGPATPPTLLIHGARDEIVGFGESERLAKRLAQAGRPHLLLRFPWATHGCDANFSGPAGQISTYAIERFLAAVMGVP